MHVTNKGYNSSFEHIEEIVGDNESKSIYVLYSGGCDSTLVLNTALLAAKKAGRVINTISFESEQLGGVKYEKIKRAEFIEYCSKKKLPIGCQIVVNIDNKNETISVGDGACVQPAIWLYNIMAYLPTDSIVLTGYIKGDDFLTYDVFQSWFQAYNGLNALFAKNINIYMPLAFYSKDNVIKGLKDGKILKYTSYCEFPNSKGEPCGNCESCQKHTAYSHVVNIIESRRRKERKLWKLEANQADCGFETKADLIPDIPEIEEHTKLKTIKKTNKVKKINNNF